MEKLLNIDSEGTVYELFNEYYVDIGGESHEDKIPIDHPDNSINSNKLMDNSVITDKIANFSVTSEKIANLAINSQKIADSAITSDKILNSAITAEKINDEAITASKIADLAITTEKIEDQSVTESKLSQDLLDKFSNLDEYKDNLSGDDLPATLDDTKDYFDLSITDFIENKATNNFIESKNYTDSLVNNLNGDVLPATLDNTKDYYGSSISDYIENKAISKFTESKNYTDSLVNNLSGDILPATLDNTKDYYGMTISEFMNSLKNTLISYIDANTGNNEFDMQVIYDLLNALENSLKEYSREYTEQYANDKVESYNDEVILPHTTAVIEQLRTELNALLDNLTENIDTVQANSFSYTDDTKTNIEKQIDYLMEITGIEKEEDFKEYNIGDIFNISDFNAANTIDIGDKTYNLSMITITNDSESMSINDGYSFVNAGVFTLTFNYVFGSDEPFKMTYKIKVNDPNNKSPLDTLKDEVADNVLLAILKLNTLIQEKDSKINELESRISNLIVRIESIEEILTEEIEE